MPKQTKGSRRSGEGPDLNSSNAENSCVDASQFPEKVSKFKFPEFNKDSDDFRYYLQRFELEIYVAGLSGDQPHHLTAHRNLLLKSVGPDVYKIVVDQFYPASLFNIDYDEVKKFLKQHFAPTTSYLAERVHFQHTYQSSNESYGQWQ